MFLTFEGFPPVIFWHFSERAGPPTAMWRITPFIWLCNQFPRCQEKSHTVAGQTQDAKALKLILCSHTLPPPSALPWGARVAPFPFCPSIWIRVGGVCSLVSSCDPSFLGKHSPSSQSCSSLSQPLLLLWNTNLIYFPEQGSLILKLQVMPI